MNSIIWSIYLNSLEVYVVYWNILCFISTGIIKEKMFRFQDAWFFFFFLYAVFGMWDPSSPTRDWICTFAVDA